MRRPWLLTIGLLLLVGCRGEELARVKLQKEGDASDVKWTVAGTRTALVWAEYDGKWKGGKSPKNVYEIELLDGDKSITKMECSTASCSSRVCSNEVVVNDEGSGNCECKTDCKLDAPNDGTFTVKATVKGGTMTDSQDLSIILRK